MLTKLLQPRAIKYPLKELMCKLQTVSALSSLLQRHAHSLPTSGSETEPRPLSTSDDGPGTLLATANSLLHCNHAAREDSRDMIVIPNFISEEEEQSLLQDIGRTLRGKRYQYDHWDGVRSKQEVVTHLSRLEAFVTGMKIFDQWKWIHLNSLSKPHALSHGSKVKW